MAVSSISPRWCELELYHGAWRWTRTHGVTVRSIALRSASSQLYWSPMVLFHLLSSTYREYLPVTP